MQNFEVGNGHIIDRTDQSVTIDIEATHNRRVTLECANAPKSGYVSVTYKRGKVLSIQSLDVNNLEPMNYWLTTLNYTANFANANVLHAFVQQSFPVQAVLHIKHRVLWRLDGDTLIIFSRFKPSLAILGAIGDQINIRQISLDGFKEGQQLHFKLVTPPFTTCFDKRVAISDPARQYEYLKSRAPKHGFKLVSVSLGRSPFKYYHRSPKEISFHIVDYKGVLEITDPKLFLNAIINGIGSNKSIGFGLLFIKELL